MAVLLVVLLVVWQSIQATLHPLNDSPYAATWYVVIFLALFGAIPLALFGAIPLAWLRRGRWLLVVTGILLGVLLVRAMVWGHNGVAFFMLGWILGVAAGCGQRVLSWGLPAWSATPLERGLTALAVGLGLLAFVVLALGLCGWLYPCVAYGMLLALTLWLGPTGWRGAGWLRTVFVPRVRTTWQTADLRWPALCVAWIVACLGSSLVWALAPAIHYDALMYHLSIPAIYVQAHGIIPVSEEFRSYWAHNTEMLYTLGLLLAGQPLPALLHWTMSVLAGGWVYALAWRLGGVRAGGLAVLLFISMPIVSREAGTANIDLAVTLYSVGFLYALMRWWQTHDNPWLVVAGLQAGWAVGTKLNVMLVLAPAIVFLLMGLLCRRGGLRRFAGSALCFGGPAIAVALPWLLRDWAWTGNPVFPFCNAFFASPLFPRENPTFDFKTYGIGVGFADLIQLPLALITRAEIFGCSKVQLGGVTLFFLPWLYLSALQPQRRLVTALLALTVVILLLWAHSVQYARYLFPAFPLFACLSALNFAALWRALSTRAWSKPALAGLLLFGAAYLTGTRCVTTVFNWEIFDRYPWKVALGYETPSAFLSRALPPYDALQFLNAQGDGRHQVASFGMEFRLYTRSRIVSLAVVPWSSIPPAQLRHKATLPARLQALGFDYLLLNQNLLRAFPAMYQDFAILDPAFLARHACLEFSRNGVEVYRLRLPATGTAGEQAKKEVGA